jgi:hypothetical protein
MAGPLGVLPVSSTAATTVAKEDIAGRPPGVLLASPAATTTILPMFVGADFVHMAPGPPTGSRSDHASVPVGEDIDSSN